MPKALCQGGGQQIAIPAGIRSGDIFDCPNGAGLTLRASEREGIWSVTEVKTASCAVGDESIILPDAAKPGDIIECHGVKQRVTYTYGAYALERIGDGETMEQRRLFKTGLWGTIVTAICCFTPLLPFLLGLVGLVVLIPYLDYVLFPLLFLFLGMALIGWRQRRSGRAVGEKACKTEQR